MQLSCYIVQKKNTHIHSLMYRNKTEKSLDIGNSTDGELISNTFNALHNYLE